MHMYRVVPQTKILHSRTIGGLVKRVMALGHAVDIIVSNYNTTSASFYA